MKTAYSDYWARVQTCLVLALVLTGAWPGWAQNVIAWGNNSQGQTNVPPSATNVIAVAAGAYHSMALQASGTVITWGKIDGGAVPSSPAGATNITSIAAGQAHCLARGADGTVFAWGDNSVGQLNIPSSATKAAAIAAGYFHNLALRTNGTVVAWGENTFGQTSVPAGLSNVVAIAAGPTQSLALLTNGSIVIWGGAYNGYYTDAGANTRAPTLASNIVALVAGLDFNMAVRLDGSLCEWGYYPPPPFVGPHAVTNLVAVATSTNFNLALRGDGTVVGWGNPYSYGSPTNIPSSATNVIAIAAGFYHGLAVTGTTAPVILGQTSFKTVAFAGDPLPLGVRALGTGPLTYQWLENGVPVSGATNAIPDIDGVVGEDLGFQVIVSDAFGSVTSSVANFAVESVNLWGSDLDHQCEPPLSLGTPVMIAAGAFHNLALESNGTVIAWGRNSSGQTNVPASATNIIAVAAGSDHSVALSSIGTVIAWGYNGYGETSVPTAATNVAAIAAGWGHSAALLGNGTVLSWGNNDYGQTNVPAYLTNVTAIAAGYYHTLALLSNHTVFSWGSQALVPAAATNVVAIAAGWESSLALRGDGTVIAWGDNSFGQCSVPASVTNAVAVAAGFGHSLALLSDGTLMEWGGNFNIPNAPRALGNVASIACGEDHEVAILNVGAPQVFSNPPPVTAHAGDSVVLGGPVAGLLPLAYQWYQNGQLVAAATNRWLTLPDLNATNSGSYTETVSNSVGTATSGPINLTVLNTPYFTPAPPVQQNAVVGTSLCVSASPAGVPPLSFLSQLNGAILTDGPQVSGGATSIICFDALSYADDGLLDLTVTNEFGSFTGLLADLAVTPIIGWGDNSSGQLLISPAATNVVAVASGGDHSLALRADGSVVAWGDNTYGQDTVPASATGVVAVAEGDTDSLALRSDGTIVAWGDNTYGQTNVPASAKGAVQIAAGEFLSDALMPNGSVIAWTGTSYKSIYNPTTATNVVAVSARGFNHLGLCANGSVVSWGTTVNPPALTNAIAIAAGANHSLALLANNTVVAWGANYYGQKVVPPEATNIIAIAAGDELSVALRADGTLITWGYTNIDQIAPPAPNPNIVTIAAGSLHGLAVLGQPLTTTVAAGGSTLLTSGNLGGALGTFQWLFNGAAIAGATNSSLALTNLQSANSGLYQVLFSNSLRVVTGPVVNIVVPPFQFNLSAFAYQSGSGTVALQLTGVSGKKTVVIYASSNLLTWHAIFTNTAAVNSFDFTDSPPPNAPQRFYQAVELP